MFSTTVSNDDDDQKPESDSYNILVNPWDIGEGRLRPRARPRLDNQPKKKVKCEVCKKFYQAKYLKVGINSVFERNSISLEDVGVCDSYRTLRLDVSFTKSHFLGSPIGRNANSAYQLSNSVSAAYERLSLSSLPTRQQWLANRMACSCPIFSYVCKNDILCPRTVLGSAENLHHPN